MVEKTGKLKSIKLDPKEVKERQEAYARLLNLKANTYRHMGDFIKADETFLKGADWIDDNLGKASIHYVRNKLWLGQMLEDNGGSVSGSCSSGCSTSSCSTGGSERTRTSGVEQTPPAPPQPPYMARLRRALLCVEPADYVGSGAFGALGAPLLALAGLLQHGF